MSTIPAPSVGRWVRLELVRSALWRVMHVMLRIALGALHYLVGYTVGFIGGIVLLMLMALGRVRTRGYWRAADAMKRGKLVIAMRHPTMLESFLFPFIAWPLFFIEAELRYFPWSMPDPTTVPLPSWLFFLWRCVLIKRKNLRVREHTQREVLRIFEQGESVIVHPGGGREFKQGARRVECGGLSMREIRSMATYLAWQSGASILPVYVDYPQMEIAADLSALRHLWLAARRLFSGGVITFCVGETYTIPPGFPCDWSNPHNEANQELEQRILAAGRLL